MQNPYGVGYSPVGHLRTSDINYEFNTNDRDSHPLHISVLPHQAQSHQHIRIYYQKSTIDFPYSLYSNLDYHYIDYTLTSKLTNTLIMNSQIMIFSYEHSDLFDYPSIGLS
jgi:hypothetical protein